jgi:hypothetical protein
MVVWRTFRRDACDMRRWKGVVVKQIFAYYVRQGLCHRPWLPAAHSSTTRVFYIPWLTSVTLGLFYSMLWGLFWAPKRDPSWKRERGGAQALSGRLSDVTHYNKPKLVASGGRHGPGGPCGRGIIPSFGAANQATNNYSFNSYGRISATTFFWSDTNSFLLQFWTPQPVKGNARSWTLWLQPCPLALVKSHWFAQFGDVPRTSTRRHGRRICRRFHYIFTSSYIIE